MLTIVHRLEFGQLAHINYRQIRNHGDKKEIAAANEFWNANGPFNKKGERPDWHHRRMIGDRLSHLRIDLKVYGIYPGKGEYLTGPQVTAFAFSQLLSPPPESARIQTSRVTRQRTADGSKRATRRQRTMSSRKVSSRKVSSRKVSSRKASSCSPSLELDLSNTLNIAHPAQTPSSLESFGVAVPSESTAPLTPISPTRENILVLLEGGFTPAPETSSGSQPRNFQPVINSSEDIFLADIFHAVDFPNGYTPPPRFPY